MKTRKLFVIEILLVLTSLTCQCQTDSVQFSQSKKLSLITAYQFYENHFIEIGIGITNDAIIGHHPNSLGYGISNELRLGNEFVWGLKAGIWMGGGAAGLNLGLNVINYSDFKRNALRFRPEIGIGFNSFRVVYGYNLTITNNEFDGINKHNFGINILLNLKTIK